MEQEAAGGEILGGDRSVVDNYGVLDNSEAEAGASGCAAASFVDTVETLEEMGKVFLGNAAAIVLHRQQYPSGFIFRAGYDYTCLLYTSDAADD